MGVKPAELGAIITQLAFYAGWPNALSAVVVAKPIFGERGIGAEQLTAGSGERLPHLNRGMENGLTKAQIAEVITHLAFYAGWPNALFAVPVTKAVFDKRTG